MTVKPIRVMDFRGTYKGGGGPDKTILNSAAMHDKEKVFILVVYLRQPDDDAFLIGKMAADLSLNYREFIDSSRIDWKCLKGLKELIRNEKIELVHSHDDKTLLYSVILKHMVPGLRIMHTCHSHSEYGRETFQSTTEYLKFRMRKRIQIELMKRHLYPVLTISENTKERLVRGGIASDNVAVMYNGIDTTKWHRNNSQPCLKEELGMREDQLLVGTVARISYDKDLPTFYSVAEQVRKKCPGVKFVIVGDGYGNELAEAKREVIELGLEEVVYFTGHRGDLLDIYSSFDIFLMTSRTEGLPNTVLEAMAMGIPVVSTAVGGIPEIILDQEEGLLAPVHDANTLTNHVCRMLEQHVLRKEMSKRSRERIRKKFDFHNRVIALEKIYIDFTIS